MLRLCQDENWYNHSNSDLMKDDAEVDCLLFSLIQPYASQLFKEI